MRKRAGGVGLEVCGNKKIDEIVMRQVGKSPHQEDLVAGQLQELA